MKTNNNFVIERLDDGSVVLLNPEKEVIYILNTLGGLVLETSSNGNFDCAKKNYFDKAKLPLTEEYSKDYDCCVNQLIESGILLED